MGGKYSSKIRQKAIAIITGKFWASRDLRFAICLICFASIGFQVAIRHRIFAVSYS